MVSEEMLFESVDGRMPAYTIAHLWAFGSVELKINSSEAIR